MMLRIVSLRIDHVVGPIVANSVVSAQNPRELREAGDAFGPTRRPPAPEQNDESRRTSGELAHEFGAQGTDLDGVLVMEEVEVVQESGGLDEVQAQERVDAPVGGVQDLNEVIRFQR